MAKEKWCLIPIVPLEKEDKKPAIVVRAIAFLKVKII